jgi:ribosomal protein S18 acetylase RimI-like enzyme
MTRIALRAATPEDDEFLLRLYGAARADEMAFWPGEAEFRDTLLRIQFRARKLEYESRFPQAQQSVVLADEDPAGNLLVARMAEEIRLVDIALLPQFRSRGTGALLIRGLLAEAALSRKPVRLQVWHTNPAVRLYARLGFQVRGETGGYLSMEWVPG